MYQLFFVLVLLFFSVSSFARLFEPQLPTQALTINTNTEKLCQVAASTSAYLQRGFEYDPNVNHANALKQFGVSSDRIKATLDFICQITQEDKARNQASRLNSFAFIEQHFEFIRWYPDGENAQRFAAKKPLLANLPNDRLLMTKYYVHLAKGHSTPSVDFPHALYALPFDESDLTLEQANEQPGLTRFQFGKQAILQQPLSADIAKPLVYLSRSDLESALLQGTVVVDSDETQTVYNVHRNNAIAYDRNLKPEQQQRYWYFKQVEGILGYGKDAEFKITVQPEVTFAGDLYQLGLGHLLLSQFNFKQHQEYRLGILADTGGAFDDNLYQLDYLAGSYHGFAEYAAANRHLPDYINVWFMVLKQPQPQ
ncbi:hypothetical protein [Pseudoalteromonas tunicata]|uniref:hypothetical protein n=1 Tax=Pseudoalteromonas tunicata TaxID=314281 RepID=UPI00273E4C09|nr:hypothetical protein [Pseudoalteromonas tunicata]MDP4983278.1 hypothetical protein [Pseudoalteromonas tunicata]